MLRSDKKLAELSKVLNDSKHNEIKARISMLRSEEPFEGALKLLAHFYDTSDDEGLKLIISGFFNDMKESSGRSEVIESISAVSRPASKAMLASSCWQSGLDYSDHAKALAEAFMSGDYMTSLECFTVLENCAEMINQEDKIGIISNLEKEIMRWDISKQQLAKELISIMKL
jgi:hypothetical protein